MSARVQQNTSEEETERWRSVDFRSRREPSVGRRSSYSARSPSRQTFTKRNPTHLVTEIGSLPVTEQASFSRERPSLKERTPLLPQDDLSEIKWCTSLEDKDIIITGMSKGVRSSGSIIAFGTMRGVDVIFKISPPDSKNNSLATERLIYKAIIPQLLDKSPHFVKYVDDFVCTNFVTKMKALAKGKDHRHRHEAAELAAFLEDKGLTDDTPVHVLVTEKAKGITLGDWLTSSLYTRYFTPKQKAKFTRDVSLQVAYTLEAMRELQFMHNDLHIDNVFVHEGENKFLYRLNGKKFYSPYFVRIYDFDHSSVQSLPANTLLYGRNCLVGFECNDYIPKLDWFIYLDWYQANSPGSISKDYFPDADLFPPTEKFQFKRGQRSWRGKPCLCDSNGCAYCKPHQTYLNKITSPAEYISIEAQFISSQ